MEPDSHQHQSQLQSGSHFHPDPTSIQILHPSSSHFHPDPTSMLILILSNNTKPKIRKHVGKHISIQQRRIVHVRRRKDGRKGREEWSFFVYLRWGTGGHIHCAVIRWVISSKQGSGLYEWGPEWLNTLLKTDMFKLVCTAYPLLSTAPCFQPAALNTCMKTSPHQT